MWEWFDGKKSFIGGLLMFVAGLTETVIVQKYQIQPQWLLIAVDIIKYVGEAGFFVGAGHKVVKKVKGE